ncbi:hypothetical protein [Methylobacterium fujisawaense]|uniref:hypothetical protein n=1 Tax=Methylobacterium fujisawaense TaxID=107400 RepID=UPI00313E27B4
MTKNQFFVLVLGPILRRSCASAAEEQSCGEDPTEAGDSRAGLTDGDHDPGWPVRGDVVVCGSTHLTA